MSPVSRVSVIVLTAGFFSAGLVSAALAQNPHAAPPIAAKTQTAAAPITPPAGQAVADTQADQKKLDDLVAAMNAATGTDKIDKIAAVVAELAARQNGMCSRMMKMSGGGMMKMGDDKMNAPRQAAPPQAPGQSSDHEQHHPKY